MERPGRKTLIHVVNFVFRALKFLLTCPNSRSCYQKQLEDLRQKGPVDILFFSQVENYTNQFNGKSYNIHLDPIIDLVRDRHSFLKLELDSSKARITMPRFESTIFINPVPFFIKRYITGKFRGSNQINVLENFIELKRIVSEITNGISIDETYFTNQSRLVERYEDFFAETLSIMRPKAVFLVCYYSPILMALIAACRKLSIQTVDMQHGKQGKYHGMFTHWTKVPEKGYELLPDFFWVWGEETRGNIQRWQPQGLRRNVPVVGGNLWLSKWIHNNRYSEASGEYKDFYNTLKQYEKIVLFTLQPMAEPFPEHLLKAMRNSPDSWIWLIRLHHCQRDRLAEIDSFLKTCGIKNYEINFSSRIFLYSLLKLTHYHLTCWSSVCYEALYFHVPTTIVHPSGKDLYQEYIDKGIFSYSMSDKEILEIIERSTSIDMIQEETPYIETDPQKADKALHKILNSNLEKKGVSCV